MNINIKNGFSDSTLVCVQKQGEPATKVCKNPGEIVTKSIDQDQYLEIWAENGSKVNCAIIFDMKRNSTESDSFTLTFNYDKNEKEWILTNPNAGQTDVQVTVGPDGQ